MPLNPSEPPHFKPTVSAESGAGVRCTRFASSKPGECLVQCAGHQRRFAPRTLLIEDQNRLAHFRIARTQFVHQHAHFAFWHPRLSTVAPATLG